MDTVEPSSTFCHCVSKMEHYRIIFGKRCRLASRTRFAARQPNEAYTCQTAGLHRFSTVRTQEARTNRPAAATSSFLTIAISVDQATMADTSTDAVAPASVWVWVQLYWDNNEKSGEPFEIEPIPKNVNDLKKDVIKDYPKNSEPRGRCCPQSIRT